MVDDNCGLVIGLIICKLLIIFDVFLYFLYPFFGKSIN